MTNEKQIIYQKLPKAIKDILLISHGWLVGGSISHLIDGKTPKDFDIIILQEHYISTSPIIRNYFTDFNTYGGYKLSMDGLSVDIWIEPLDHFILSANKFTYAYNLRKNVLIKNL